MAPPPCAKCKQEIKDDSEKFDCDACGLEYHLLCDTVKKGDVTARSKSKNLKLYCTRCMSGKLEIANAEKLSIIYKYVTKIDSQTQSQVAIQVEASNKLDSVIAASAIMREDINEVKKSIAANGDDGKLNSYANVLRSAGETKTKMRVAAQPTVMIKPKNVVQTATATSNDIKEKIKCKDVDACGMRKLHGGGVAVRCATNAASLKMKSIIEQQFGDKYEVKLPEKMKPRVKIFRVDGVAEADLINELKQRNEWLAEGDIVVKKVIQSKVEKYMDYDVVIEVDQASFEKLMDARRVNLGWRSCRVIHHVHLTRCYKCCGFGHVAERCTNKLACAKCSGEHKTSECDKNKNSAQCVNCKTMNDKYKTKYDTKHAAWSTSCEVFKKRADRFAMNFVGTINQ